MQIINEQYGPFVIELVVDYKTNHLRGYANAFAGPHNCNMPREFDARNSAGQIERISRYDLSNRGRKFQVDNLEFSNNQYRVARGSLFSEVASGVSPKPAQQQAQPQAVAPAQQPTAAAQDTTATSSAHRFKPKLNRKL